jgi:hypothetical protein
MNKINTITYGYMTGNKDKIHHVSVQCNLEDEINKDGFTEPTHYIEVDGKRYRAKGYIVCINLKKLKKPV